MSDDTEVGARVQRLRERHGLTQATLANAMVGQGHPWHQQTVVKTEKGLRPLRLTEASALADALHCTLGDLTGDLSDGDHAALRSLLARCLEADDAVTRATATADSVRARLSEALDDATDVPTDLRTRIERMLGRHHR